MRTWSIVILLCWSLVPPVFSQKTIVLQPGPADGKDAYINSAYPDDTGGSNEGLIACAWTFGGAFGIGRSLIRFDLSQLPPGTEILDARLTLYYDPEVAFGLQSGYNASYLNKVTEDWNEMNLTWNNQPGYSGTSSVFIPETQYSSQDLTNIDIKAFVSDWVLHPETNFGFIHQMVTEIEYCCLVYSSSDKPAEAKRPKLVVTYRECDPPVAGFGYQVQLPTVYFSDSSGSVMNWNWDFGDGYFSNLKNPVHAYSQPGVYRVCLAIQDSCGRDTICDSVRVCKFPDPGFSFVSKGNLVSFADSSFEPLSWYWDFNDGFYSDLKDPEHFFNRPGTYYVCEQVRNACALQSWCDSVKIIASGFEDHPGSLGIQVYPNPARDLVFMRIPARVGSDVSIELMSAQSCTVRKWPTRINANDVPVSLDLTGLPGGIYLLQTKIGGFIQLDKLIIL